MPVVPVFIDLNPLVDQMCLADDMKEKSKVYPVANGFSVIAACLPLLTKRYRVPSRYTFIPYSIMFTALALKVPQEHKEIDNPTFLQSIENRGLLNIATGAAYSVAKERVCPSLVYGSAVLGLAVLTDLNTRIGGGLAVAKVCGFISMMVDITLLPLKIPIWFVKGVANFFQALVV
jgi:hypothetical protein